MFHPSKGFPAVPGPRAGGPNFELPVRLNHGSLPSQEPQRGAEMCPQSGLRVVATTQFAKPDSPAKGAVFVRASGS